MITISILILAFLYNKKFIIGGTNGSVSISGNDIYLIVTFIIMTSIMALRSPSVGFDTAPYTRIFSIISNSGSLLGAIEIAPLSAPVYVIICWIISKIIPDPQAMIIFSSIFVNLGLWIFVKKRSINPAISIFCWIGLSLYYCSMNGNRQFMALVLTLNALSYFSDNVKSFRGWLFMLIALGIHSTSLISLIAVAGIVLSDRLKSSKIIFNVSIFISVVISVAYSKLVKVFINFFPRYAMYNDGTSTYSIFTGTGGGRIVVVYLLLFGICILWLLANKKNNDDIDIFHKKMLPALVFCTIFGVFNCKNELINRMLWFYTSIYITFIPCVLKKYKKISIIFTICIIVALGAYSVMTLLENQNGIVPYKFFFNR